MSQENVNASEEVKAPSKEEVIAFFQEQIDVKKIQLELQDLNTKLAVARAEEIKALSFIAQMTSPKAKGDEYAGGVPHTVTQEDLDNNPEMVEAGVQVGDEVIIPNMDVEKTAGSASKKERSLKKK